MSRTPSPNVAIVSETVDNPADGNCAPYSFAIGLMDIIQNEHLYKCSEMFDRWCALDPSIEDLYQDIIQCPLSKRLPKSTMLTRLQASIRQLSLQTQSRALKNACADLRECKVRLILQSLEEPIDLKRVIDGHEILILSNANGYTFGFRNLAGEYEERAIEDEHFLQLLRARKTPSDITDSVAINHVNKLLSDNQYLASVLPFRKYIGLFNNELFVLFLSGYYGTQDSDFSRSGVIRQLFDVLRLQLTREATQLGRELTHDEEQTLILHSFLTTLYGEYVDHEDITPNTPFAKDSPIVAVLNLITEPFHFLYFQDIYVLAPLFKVNFHFMRDGAHIQEYKDDPNLPTITMENLNNAHFVTHVVVAESLSSCESSHTYDVSRTPKRVASQPKASQPKVPESRPKASQPKTPAVKPKAAGPKPSGGGGSVGPTDAEIAAALKAAQEAEAEEAIKQQLARLKGKIVDVTEAYIKYNKSVPFSIFHRHGRTGRRRAEQFRGDILNLNSIEEVQGYMIAFLNDKTNGNTHPHSFRTMLLQEFLMDPRPNLQVLSRNYPSYLKAFESSCALVENAPRPSSIKG